VTGQGLRPYARVKVRSCVALHLDTATPDEGQLRLVAVQPARSDCSLEPCRSPPDLPKGTTVDEAVCPEQPDETGNGERGSRPGRRSRTERSDALRLAAGVSPALAGDMTPKRSGGVMSGAESDAARQQSA